jgi:hypothetical protein
MVMNQIVLEFLGQGLVVGLLYGFWLMLGLVLFNTWKEFIEFFKAIGRAIMTGLTWTFNKIAFFFSLLWRGITFIAKGVWVGILWVWKYLKLVLKGILFVLKAIWKQVVKAAKAVAAVAVYLWLGFIKVLKVIVQLSWWLLAGIAIAIVETIYILIRTLGFALRALFRGFVVVIKWVFLPIYAGYKWLIIDQKRAPLKFDLNPFWIKTTQWFAQQWSTLIFKVNGQPVKKKVSKVAAPRVVKPLKVQQEDRVIIQSVRDVNQAQVNKLKALVAKEEAMDDVSASKEAKQFELRKVFSKPFTAKADFFQRLPEALQVEFTQLFGEQNDRRLIPEISFVQGSANQAFFDKVFNFIYRLRKTISVGLLTRMVEEGIRLSV